ncbi:hypothetical protein C9374_003704 [Naegleria lovaniensis]|uniref:Uncharacterized protein n=1 Tax=Naegleria lovaniensis TaxID=51637 RepID=A0AA88KYE0_NAELO|nr:uncharacterized protein C9374_003704 [Naegleria lovaniensis]KAG2393940.1 hypothetical protein C9374_003704 [Naegleria lovaniensis]
MSLSVSVPKVLLEYGSTSSATNQQQLNNTDHEEEDEEAFSDIEDEDDIGEDDDLSLSDDENREKTQEMIEKENEELDKILQLFNNENIFEKNDAFMLRSEMDKKYISKEAEAKVRNMYEDLYVGHLNRKTLHQIEPIELLFFLTNYKNLNWNEILIRAQENKRLEVVRNAIQAKLDEQKQQEEEEEQNSVEGFILRKVKNYRDKVVTSMDARVEETIKHILSVLYFPVKKGNTVKPLIDFGPKRLKPRLRSIVKSIFYSDYMYIEGQEDPLPGEEESDPMEVNGSDIAQKELENMCAELLALRAEKRAFTEEEELIIDVTRDKYYESLNENRRQAFEIRNLKEQLEGRLNLIAKMNEVYVNEFQKLKMSIIEKLEQKKSFSDDIMLLSTMGGSLIADFSSLLEEERKKAQDLLKTVRITFGKEKKIMENQKLKEMQLWKQKLESLVQDRNTTIEIMKKTYEEEKQTLIHELSNEKKKKTKEAKKSTKSHALKRELSATTVATKEKPKKYLVLHHSKGVSIEPRPQLTTAKPYYSHHGNKDQHSSDDEDNSDEERKVKPIPQKKSENIPKKPVKDVQPFQINILDQKRVKFLRSAQKSTRDSFESNTDEEALLKDESFSQKDKSQYQYVKLENELSGHKKQNRLLKAALKDRTEKLKAIIIKLKQVRQKREAALDELDKFREMLKEEMDTNTMLRIQIKNLTEQIRRYSKADRLHRKNTSSQLLENEVTNPVAVESPSTQKEDKQKVSRIKEHFGHFRNQLKHWPNNEKAELNQIIDIDAVEQLQTAVAEAGAIDSTFSKKLHKWDSYVRRTALKKFKSTPNIDMISEFGIDVSLERRRKQFVSCERMVQTDISCFSTDTSKESFMAPSIAVPRELNSAFDTIEEQNDLLDELIGDIEQSCELTDMEKTNFTRIKAKKNELVRERQERWGKVVHIAQQLTNFSLGKGQVPLSISTIDQVVGLENELRNKANIFRILPSTFARSTSPMRENTPSTSSSSKNESIVANRTEFPYGINRRSESVGTCLVELDDDNSDVHLSEMISGMNNSIIQNNSLTKNLPRLYPQNNNPNTRSPISFYGRQSAPLVRTKKKKEQLASDDYRQFLNAYKSPTKKPFL